jgi:hypothetical protein
LDTCRLEQHGFSVALEIIGSAKGRTSTAKAQIAQALRLKIVANVSL